MSFLTRSFLNSIDQDTFLKISLQFMMETLGLIAIFKYNIFRIIFHFNNYEIFNLIFFFSANVTQENGNVRKRNVKQDVHLQEIPITQHLMASVMNFTEVAHIIQSIAKILPSYKKLALARQVLVRNRLLKQCSAPTKLK